MLNNFKMFKPKKKIILSVFLVLIFTLNFAETLYVDEDGGQDYITIQQAVNVASWGDSIIVYPGIYQGTVSFQGKAITIASLELTTGDESYIKQTIIDGDEQSTCVMMNNLCFGKLQGFTIRNGYSNSDVGSGINIISSSQSSVKNCYIFNNKAKEKGAGLLISGSFWLTLSGLSIHDNRASSGSGLSIYNSRDITFDPGNRCSVYNNMGCTGADIVSYFNTGDINVVLDTTTVENPSPFFVRHSASEHEFNLEYENVFMEEIDHDLYVAPNGDNANDGLSSKTPLQSIQMAVYRIKSNPDNPHTIHLALGDYSLELNNQIYPIASKSHVSIRGKENTNIILDDYLYAGLVVRNVDNFKLMSLNFYPKISRQKYYSFSYSTNFLIKDVDFNSNESNIVDTHWKIRDDITGIIDNVNITGISAEYRSIAQIEDFTGEIRNCNFSENVVLDSEEAGCALVIGLEDANLNDGPALIMENCLLQNNIVNAEISIFGDNYWWYGEHRAEVILNNLIFINNRGRSIEKNFLFAFGYGPDPVYMNNCAFINNKNVGEWSISFAGNMNINNTIIHNDPLRDEEIRLCDTMTPQGSSHPYPTNVVFNNCAIRGGENSYIDIDPENNSIEFNNTIDFDEYELSDIFTYEDSTDYMSYQLKENSALINAGYYNEEHYMPELDFLGRTRVWDGQIDIGPYEYGSVGTNDEPETEVPPLEDLEIRNFPNPFRPGNGRNNTGTTIAFKTPKFGRITIEIFNIKGQFVKRLKNVSMSKGEHQVWWHGFNENNSRVSSGIYFCKIQLDDKAFGIHKMLLLK